ncbi:MAG: hypothetical protein E7A72_10355 [Actinomyces urogenitalis]|uniref:ImmA/IrrE family metallo-endopeptidase n=1 Tax=Actinomyces urogenitalis TaxID=103621 RepID=A0A2I1KVZ1_9ACTO|nr:hypothetical protein [Actinomyces urogenitalis]MBS5977874.1 hypothetical protein [Actinomyces urogenitalis]MDU0973272.1 hypothetical protein [Actinomyces urogenitalis]MDU6150603.1 hypothetical protein [Actinomyces urogenitalis]PKY99800.1 hypothetical protein CYJ26_02750 [Actinomyces urogenitalis]
MTRPTLTSALDAAEAAGLFVTWVPMADPQRGAFFLPTRTIYLREDMADAVALPTLLHEMEHARRGDDGHQSRAVERRIDETVAHTLITADDYARAEAVTGARDSGAIAVEMGVPRWVVSAYRRTLRRVRWGSSSHARCSTSSRPTDSWPAG